MVAYFITHPEVELDPQTPVPRWSLSDAGVARMRRFLATDVLSGVTAVWASAETKAIEAAGLAAGRLGLPVQVHPGLGENDRTATGFLPPAEFEQVADAFFARPAESVRGWEPAEAAQARVKRAVLEILASSRRPGDLAVISHGAVGTLLMCALAGWPISRQRDQPHQGCYFTFDPGSLALAHGWRPIAPIS